MSSFSFSYIYLVLNKASTIVLKNIEQKTISNVFVNQNQINLILSNSYFKSFILDMSEDNTSSSYKVVLLST